MKVSNSVYDKKKDSGVHWLGVIPDHWEVVRGSSVLNRKRIINHGLIENTVLSLSYGKIVIKPPEKLHGLVPESFETYQLIKPLDIIIRPTDLQNDWVTIRVGISYERGIITSAYICLRTKDQVKPKYGYYLLLAYDLKKIFYGMGSGLRQNLDWSDFKRLPVLIPPREEQDQIARYLDNKLAKINRYIKNKKKMIELLKEQKQAIINQAVTKGLDPNVKMKPSGIEWLGDIPEDWDIKPLRIFLSSVSVKNKPNLKLLSVVRERGVIVRDINNTEENHNFIPDDLRGYKVVKEGQFVMNKMKAWQGSYGVSDFNGIVSPAYYVFNLNFKNKKYFHHAIRSKPYVNLFASASDGIRTGQWDLSIQKMKEIPFIMPPEKEQEEIVDYIIKKLASIEKGIKQINKEIDLITEYRTSLISAVVTGKVDVRDIEVEDIPEELEANAEILDDEIIGEEDIPVSEEG